MYLKLSFECNVNRENFSEFNVFRFCLDFVRQLLSFWVEKQKIQPQQIEEIVVINVFDDQRKNY